MESNTERGSGGFRNNPIFQWPNSAVIIGFLAVLTLVKACTPVGVSHHEDTSVGDPDTGRNARYWGHTDQVKIDRWEDKGWFLFGQPVPGGCLYEGMNSDDPSDPPWAGGMAFAPFPCPKDSGRTPQDKPDQATTPQR